MKDIIVSDISYKVKDKKILDQVNFTVNRGAVFALLGENGSGKSTLIDIILNDLKPSSGQIEIFGTTKPICEQVGVLYDHLPLFWMLSVDESIRYFATIHRLNYADVKAQYFDVFDIHPIKKNLIKELSQGEKKRLGILLAIMHQPKLLLMDEPFANLDPTIIDRIWKAVQVPGRTILFTTHDWKKAEKQASQIAFIHQGKIIDEPKAPRQVIQTLPTNQKIIIRAEEGVLKSLLNYPHYASDGNIHFFFEEGAAFDKIRNITNNFSVQNVDLQDAYLFHVNQINI